MMYCFCHVAVGNLIIPLYSAITILESCASRSSGYGFLSGLKSLVGSKTITNDDMKPVMDKMKDHLIGKQYSLNCKNNFTCNVSQLELVQNFIIILF